MPIRVVIVDDHSVLRGAMRKLLSLTPDIVVCGEAGDGLSAVETTLRLRPDVVVMDIGLPEIDGLEATRRIHAKAPDCAVLIVSAFGDSARALAAIEAGADGYVLKDTATEELHHAVKAVAARQAYLSSRIADTVLYAWLDQRPDQLTGYLSPAMRKIFDLFLAKNSVSDIAQTLNMDISVVTALKHTLVLSMIGASRKAAMAAGKSAANSSAPSGSPVEPKSIKT